MRAFMLTLDGTARTARQALGAVVCAGVRGPDGRRLLSKGHIVREEDLPVLARTAQVTLSLLMPEEGDLHEDEAAMRLGHAVAGPGVEVRGPVEARARLVAAHRGLLRVNVPALNALNSLPDVCVYTLLDGRPVEAGEVVAEAKVTPLVVRAAEVAQAEALAVEAATHAPVVRVLAFRAMRAAALVRERSGPGPARRLADGLAAKLAWFGSTLHAVQYAPLDAPPDLIAATLHAMLAEGAGLLIVTGGSASDPADPLLNALPRMSARPERVGIPAHPGSMLWLAYVDEGRVPVLGVPSCGMFSQVTALDLVLPRILAGDEVSASTFAFMGHGGLLDRRDPRFPAYRGTAEETPGIMLSGLTNPPGAGS
jgi:hypothetical protein